MTEKSNKKKGRGMCQCRNCGYIFHSSNIEKEKAIHTGLKIKDNVCPECGSIDFGLIDNVYIKSDKWLYANAKNYGDIDKFIKLL